MSDSNDRHPDSHGVEFAPEGDGVYVFTPCHGTRVFLPLAKAAPGARLRLVCPERGEGWLIEFVVDDEAEAELRAVWTEASSEEGGAVSGDQCLGCGRVESSSRGDGVFVSTPCHGVRAFLRLEDAVVGAHLSLQCPRDGRQWLLELIADEQADAGLRAVWTEADPGAGQ